tara:strand:+ start:1852 stop:2127 length:276 start_codon:yes stop_codon:yes gene_type:complete
LRSKDYNPFRLPIAGFDTFSVLYTAFCKDVFFLFAQTLDAASLLLFPSPALLAALERPLRFLDILCVGVFKGEEYHGLDVYLAIKCFTLLH